MQQPKSETPQSPAPVPSLDPKPVDLKPLRKSFIPDLMRQAKQAATATRKFVDSNPSQQLVLNGQKYARVEAWQLVGACFGHSALITSTQEIEDTLDVPGFLAVAHIRNADGQIVSGAEAMCMRNEPYWSEKPSFQVRSMAQTRAIGKAFRGIFGWVMTMAGFCPTPAEEMEYQKSFEELPSAPPRSTRDSKKTVTQRQIDAFQEACAANGKTADEQSGYLLTKHQVSDVSQLGRGKPYTEAITWASSGAPMLSVVAPKPQPAPGVQSRLPLPAPPIEMRIGNKTVTVEPKSTSYAL